MCVIYIYIGILLYKNSHVYKTARFRLCAYLYVYRTHSRPDCIIIFALSSRVRFIYVYSIPSNA